MAYFDILRIYKADLLPAFRPSNFVYLVFGFSEVVSFSTSDMPSREYQ